MPLTFSPRPGEIVICDFSTGFRPPEMVKVRPVVVISPRRRTSQLVTVVPLSTTPPDPVEPLALPVAAGGLPKRQGTHVGQVRYGGNGGPVAVGSSEDQSRRPARISDISARSGAALCHSGRDESCFGIVIGNFAHRPYFGGLPLHGFGRAGLGRPTAR